MRTVKTVICLVIACACGPASADVAADMRRCRLEVDATARLACYDAVVLQAVDGSVAPSNEAAAVASQPSSPGPTGPTAAFGLESRPTRTQTVEAVESSIPGRFDGWLARERFSLANGQVWEISDGSQAAYRLEAPKVRITRGLSGTFFMTIEGVSQTPRVRRIK